MGAKELYCKQWKQNSCLLNNSLNIDWIEVGTENKDEGVSWKALIDREIHFNRLQPLYSSEDSFIESRQTF